MLPSQLKEGQFIRISSDNGCIEFYREYGELATVAKNTNQQPRDASGLQITTNELLADAIYREYTALIHNRDTNQQPSAQKDVIITRG